MVKKPIKNKDKTMPYPDLSKFPNLQPIIWVRVAIMQPYFLPYVGYFHLINSVDEFVIYDNIQYTKKGWINRNRILVNGNDKILTLPLKKRFRLFRC